MAFCLYSSVKLQIIPASFMQYSMRMQDTIIIGYASFYLRGS
jgi:hypothetical protein